MPTLPHISTGREPGQQPTTAFRLGGSCKSPSAGCRPTDEPTVRYSVALFAADSPPDVRQAPCAIPNREAGALPFGGAFPDREAGTLPFGVAVPSRGCHIPKTALDSPSTGVSAPKLGLDSFLTGVGIPSTEGDVPSVELDSKIIGAGSPRVPGEAPRTSVDFRSIPVDAPISSVDSFWPEHDSPNIGVGVPSVAVESFCADRGFLRIETGRRSLPSVNAGGHIALRIATHPALCTAFGRSGETPPRREPGSGHSRLSHGFRLRTRPPHSPVRASAVPESAGGRGIAVESLCAASRTQSRRRAM